MGRLKTRNWKTRDHLTAGGGKRETGKCGTNLHGWKTQKTRDHHTGVW